MKNSDYNTVNNIIACLPTKTESAPGTLVIDNVEGYNQIDLSAAASKYWIVEHKYSMIDFEEKLVNGNILNKFAKKINKKIKSEISSIDMGIDEDVLDAMLQEIYGNNDKI
jgi:hypothetical protein